MSRIPRICGVFEHARRLIHRRAEIGAGSQRPCQAALTMHPSIRALFHGRGAIRAGELQEILSAKRISSLIRDGHLHRPWHGVYTLPNPTVEIQLRALDLVADAHVPVCMGNGCGQLRLRHRTRRRAPRDQSGARPAETAPQSRSPPASGSPLAVCRRAVDHRTRLDRHRDRANTQTVARHRNTRCRLAVRALLTRRIATCRTNAGRTSWNCPCSRPADPRGWQVRIAYGERDAFAIHRFRSSGARTSGNDLRPLRNSVARGLPVAFSPPHRRIRQRRMAQRSGSHAQGQTQNGALTRMRLDGHSYYRRRHSASSGRACCTNQHPSASSRRVNMPKCAEYPHI